MAKKHMQTKIYLTMRTKYTDIPHIWNSIGRIGSTHPGVEYRLAGISDEPGHTNLTLEFTVPTEKNAQSISSLRFVYEIFTNFYQALPHYAAAPSTSEEISASHFLNFIEQKGHQYATNDRISIRR